MVILSFNSEFGGHDSHPDPSINKPVVQTQCAGVVEPGGAVEEAWHLLQVI